jgi:pimeloyl-ACP methyl ester carboxylesterase
VLGLAAVVGVLGYTGYVGLEASGRLVLPDDVSRACTTPAQYGWPYEAVNYDQAEDAALAAANPDLDACASQGAVGSEVVTVDGVSLDGWYIPAASEPAVGVPTILVAHGHSDNKSSILPLVALLHDRYDVLVVDLRGSGRSAGREHGLGTLERLDVAAMLDWLEATKDTDHVAALGVSGGAAAVLAAARTDDRIEAVIADSTHATIERLIAGQIEANGHPAYPGTWGTLVGIWARTGQVPGSADPIESIALLGDRPLLILHGSADETDRPADSAELNLAAAREHGVAATHHYCEGAGHAAVASTCDDAYGEWVADFLEAAFPEAAAP